MNDILQDAYDLVEKGIDQFPSPDEPLTEESFSNFLESLYQEDRHEIDDSKEFDSLIDILNEIGIIYAISPETVKEANKLCDTQE